jgi:polyhydroxyalkanoate synthase
LKIENAPLPVAALAAGAEIAEHASTLSTAVAESLQSLTKLNLPAPALVKLQSEYLTQSAELWNRLLTPGSTETPALRSGDRRFASDAWSLNPATSFLSQMYLLNARTLLQLAESVEADAKTKARIRFAVQQWVDAAAPSNYLALNPEAQRKALETRGESIGLGLKHLWHDLHQGHMSQTDETVFEVGRNVATTEGSVVYENELFQLIEYKPLTAKVYARPMLLVPPCINKFYILDLQPENSLIRYTVEQGHRVFVLSWRNATSRSRSTPGIITSPTVPSARWRWSAKSPAATRSTRSASASAAPSWPRRLRRSRRVARSRRPACRCSRPSSTSAIPGCSTSSSTKPACACAR